VTKTTNYPIKIIAAQKQVEQREEENGMEMTFFQKII
jgi:hypothetical protein